MIAWLTWLWCTFNVAVIIVRCAEDELVDPRAMRFIFQTIMESSGMNDLKVRELV